MDEKNIKSSLKDLLIGLAGSDNIDIRPLAQSGSPRQYYRISAGDKTYIGTYVPDPSEGECFVKLSEVFGKYHRHVPQVFATSEDGHFYIQKDLGDRSLFSVLSTPKSMEHIKETLQRLVLLQKTPEDAWASVCIAKPFSKRQIMWDLNYFKYEYLKPQEIVFDEELLEDDFELLAGRLMSIPDEFHGFMMRDCQSRNVMLTEDGPIFIDYQGGRKGPALYDAVSLLWQARAGFSNEFRKEMLDFYCNSYCDGESKKISEMLSWLSEIVLYRTLQVLGAYGFRGLVQHKAHFLLSIPGALSNLRTLLEDGALDNYPELKKCAVHLIMNAGNDRYESNSVLTVEVFSFSYKKGYPEDYSGNGGGFMFDCRAMHNPGRYEQYKTLTGRNKEVVDFLEDRGEVQNFLKYAWCLIDPSIERYATRGFTHLQIGFGCTGGRHRSVYCAERTAAHIREIFPEVNVILIHREHPE